MSAATERAPGWGVWLQPVSPVRTLVELARAAEDEGASHVLVADEGTDRDLHVTMAAILLGTRRVVVASGITNPWSRHPVTTAAAFATLDELAPGRVILGIGTGGSRVFDPLGLEVSRPYTALVEATGVIDRLLAGERVDHEGTFRAVGAELPWARARLPIAVAGRGPRVESWATRTADWVLLNAKPVADLPDVAASVRARAAEAGRSVRIGWSSYIGWTDADIEAIRPHFTYATVDMPAATREALGIPAWVVEDVRRVWASDGFDAAGRLVPLSVVERAALLGADAAIVARLSHVRATAGPDLFVLSLQDHATGVRSIARAAPLIRRAGFGAARPEPSIV